MMRYTFASPLAKYCRWQFLFHCHFQCFEMFLQCWQETSRGWHFHVSIVSVIGRSRFVACRTEIITGPDANRACKVRPNDRTESATVASFVGTCDILRVLDYGVLWVDH